mmetsp:Transcript_33626/g.66620  ORF Transcript_33626/g.66620 Transcript_33626/m.66620 type:complete len:597 (+) Transcript_33626:109-1899(+)
MSSSSLTRQFGSLAVDVCTQVRRLTARPVMETLPGPRSAGGSGVRCFVSWVSSSIGTPAEYKPPPGMPVPPLTSWTVPSEPRPFSFDVGSSTSSSSSSGSGTSSSSSAQHESTEKREVEETGSKEKETGKMSSRERKNLKPSEMVDYLDKYIVGQGDAKRAVANALRSRWRRLQLKDHELRDDITPKNILMIGPTGVGKTEIARRLSKLVDAPFIKVEATKFTEVGFHGRDVDSILKDLVELAMKRQRGVLEEEMREEVEAVVSKKLLEMIFGKVDEKEDKTTAEQLSRGELDEREVDVPQDVVNMAEVHLQNPEGSMEPRGGQTDPAIFETFVREGDSSSGRPTVIIQGSKKRGSSGGAGGKVAMSVSEARSKMMQAEFNRKISTEMLMQRAVSSCEEEGIVFIDEIDKICTKGTKSYSGPDASAEGVQRDLLPLIEGCLVSTKYGNVKTDHILFIASGAFHSVKPSDMMAELQGRLPVRVELQALKEEDFVRILQEPRNNLIRQHQALLATEEVELSFEDEAILEIAKVATEVNTHIDNIGARRLHTILEKLLEEISFEAPRMEAGTKVSISAEKVRESVGELLKKADLSRFLL